MVQGLVLYIMNYNFKFQVLFMPDTNKWEQLAQEFENKWQMPNCLGSIDGKHIVHQV